VDRNAKVVDRTAKIVDRNAKVVDRTAKTVERTAEMPDRTVNLKDRIYLSPKKSPAMAIFFIGIEKFVMQSKTVLDDNPQCLSH